MSNKQECQELKNIKYKSMLLSGTSIVTDGNNNSGSIDQILENESILNKKEPWNKLDKTIKIQKINHYIDTVITKKFSLNETEELETKQYLQQSLDRVKLQRAKEVDYNKDTGAIKNILNLQFNHKSRKFTLKRCEKRVSTLKSLGNPANSKKNREKIKERLKEKPKRKKVEKIDTKTV